MTPIYEKKTGKILRVDHVDAREILKNSDLYTANMAEVKKEIEADDDFKTPHHEPRVSDSGLPAGAEFTRRILAEDQALLRNQRRLESEGDPVKPARSANLTVQEMKDKLDALGVVHKSGMSKYELAALLDAA